MLLLECTVAIYLGSELTLGWRIFNINPIKIYLAVVKLLLLKLTATFFNWIFNFCRLASSRVCRIAEVVVSKCAHNKQTTGAGSKEKRIIGREFWTQDPSDLRLHLTTVSANWIKNETRREFFSNSRNKFFGRRNQAWWRCIQKNRLRVRAGKSSGLGSGLRVKAKIKTCKLSSLVYFKLRLSFLELVEAGLKQLQRLLQGRMVSLTIMTGKRDKAWASRELEAYRSGGSASRPVPALLRRF